MRTTRVPAHRSRSRQAASPNRAAGYDRPSDASALPEKFFNSRIRLTTVCPETALIYAVLEDAFLCFHKQFEKKGRFNRQARQAEQWFFSDDFDGLFSFSSICRVLGLEPEYIKRKLRHWDPS
jgi:hypothetical protein